MLKIDAKAKSGEYNADNEISVLEKLILKCGADSDIPYITAFDMIGAGIDTTGMHDMFIV